MMTTPDTLRLLPLADGDREFAATLYESAFPLAERRSTSLWLALPCAEPDFHIDGICLGLRCVGFVAYWLFDGFAYVEHFAVDGSCRGQGVGGKCLAFLRDRVGGRPVVLEVELPETAIARRRIAFYERHGYALLPTAYMQPPYREGGECLPMKLMCSDAHFGRARSEEIVVTLRRRVYGVKGN